MGVGLAKSESASLGMEWQFPVEALRLGQQFGLVTKKTFLELRYQHTQKVWDMANLRSYDELVAENLLLKKRVDDLEKAAQGSEPVGVEEKKSLPTSSTARDPSRVALKHELSNEEILRYGRQMLVPEWGVEAQSKIRRARVLCIGAGGLGCPVVLYLAAAGVGTLGVTDPDTVGLDNLHRQVLHSEATVGMLKVDSIKQGVTKLNSNARVITYPTAFTSDNAMDIAKDYDILVDASDNVATRYLVNDCAVLLHKPLVSGSALRLEGQVTVYHHNGGPCYRCIFPKPPPPESVTNCSDGGVLGAVTGVIGTVQACEVLKVITGMKAETLAQKLLLFDFTAARFMTVRLRSRNPQCAVCGDTPSVTKLVDYVMFCGASQSDKPIDGDAAAETAQPGKGLALQTPVTDYAKLRQAGRAHVLLDVRADVQFRIAALPGSLHIPLAELSKRMDEVRDAVQQTVAASTGGNTDDESGGSVYVYALCRRGVDSLVAARQLRDEGIEATNLTGGLRLWTQMVDPDFPLY